MNFRYPLFFLFLIGSVSLFGQNSYIDSIAIHRENYQQKLLEDERAFFFSEKKDLEEMDFYSADESLIIKALFIAKVNEKPFEMGTYSGETKPYIKYGELLFSFPGKGTQKLIVYQSLKALKVPIYRDHLFIPFKDLTNGEETYGGGRYIDMKISDIKKGIAYIDFNKAYNPWCAYAEGFSCPIPPIENHLKIEITAGEKKYLGEKKTSSVN